MRTFDETELAAVANLRCLLRSGRAREIREAAGLRQAEVARSIGVTPSALSTWETARRSPRGEAALRYASLLASLERLAPGSRA